MELAPAFTASAQKGFSSSVALRFFTVQKTIDIIGKAAPAQVIFLIVKTPQDAQKSAFEMAKSVLDMLEK